MNPFENIFNNYRNKGILIDSNILLLFLVGTYNPLRIQNFKRTQKYTVEDFDLLKSFVKFFTKVITTPNILTEVSNLCSDLPEQFKLEFVKQIEVLKEHYVPSSEISKLEHFKKYGLTDSGIINLVKGKYLVLSDDLPLVGYLQSKYIDAINFTNLRIINWQ